MQLLDHVSISVMKLSEVVEFYDAVMAALDCEKVWQTEAALGYGQRCSSGENLHSYLTVCESLDTRVDAARHWCFKAGSREQVEAFYRAGLAAGGRCDGEPGLRPHYHSGYYAAFVCDPCGNRLEAVCHSG